MKTVFDNYNYMKSVRTVTMIRFNSRSTRNNSYKKKILLSIFGNIIFQIFSDISAAFIILMLVILNNAESNKRFSIKEKTRINQF